MACSSQTASHPTRVQLCPTSLRGPGSLHHRAPPTPRSPQEPGCPTALQLSPSSSSQPATARPATQPLTTATLFVQHGFSRFPSALSLSNCRFGYPAAGGRHWYASLCVPRSSIGGPMSWSLDKAGGMWCDAGVRKRLERFRWPDCSPCTDPRSKGLYRNRLSTEWSSDGP